MYVAVDVGASKVLVAAFTASGVISSQEKFETPQKVEDFQAALIKTIARVSEGTPIEAIVLAQPGQVDREHKILLKDRNLPWQNVDFGAWAKENFPEAIFDIENDAKLGGLGEATFGNGKGVSRLLYVTIGTGVNFAYLIEGKLEPLTLNSEGAEIVIGDGTGNTFEARASGSALIKKYGKPGSEISDPEIWRAYAEELGKGIFNLVAVLEPALVLLGGGLAVHFDQFGTLLDQAMSRLSSGFKPLPEIREALRPEQAVVYGAYARALEIINGSN